MESTINPTRNEKLQLRKEQMIQRSKDAESKEEGHYYLCLADLYTLAIENGQATMFGSTLTVTVGSDDDAVSKVCIEVITDFSSLTNHFETSFSQWQGVPCKLIREASDKHFGTAEEAFRFIVGLSQKINAFFNNIQI